MKGIGVKRAGLLAAAALACGIVVPALAATASAPDDAAWAKGSQWLALRAGYAKSTAEGAGDGMVGYGFGYRRFLSRKWALGMYVHHDLVGRFGAASEIEVPMTLEIARHFNWKTPLHPYLGLGGGTFYHKHYRTGADRSELQPGGYLTLGADTPIARGRALGFDVRMAVVKQDKNSVDPVFGREKANAVHWSIKLNYAVAY